MPDLIDIQADPDNPSTVILDRWPDESEKSDEFKGFVAYARGTTPELSGELQSGTTTATGTLTGKEPSEPGNGSEGLGEGDGEDEVEGFRCEFECDHVPFKTAGARTTHQNKQHAD